MFKKTLLALALAGTASFAANAVTTLTGAVDLELSAQGAASETNIAQSGLSSTDLVFTLDAAAAAALTNGDDLVVTLTGATFGLGTNVVAAFTDGQGTNDTTLDLTAVAAYSGSNTATIAVGAIGGADTDGITALNLITVTGVVFDAASALASGEVSATIHLVDSAGSAVYGAVTETVFTFEDQFTVAASGTILDAQIQVAADRMEFAGSATTDTVVMTLAEDANTIDTTFLEAQPTTVTYTLSSERGFAYLDTDSDGTKDLAIVGSSAPIDGQDTFVTTFAADDLTATIVQSVVDTTPGSAGLDTAVTFTIAGGDGDTIINRDTFTVDSTVFAYTDNTAVAGTFAGTANIAAGAWTIAGGAVIDVTTVPFGDGLFHGFNIANTGTTTGVAELVVSVDGVDTSYTLTTPIIANGVTKLGAEIKALSLTEDWFGKSVNFEFVVTVPGAGVSMNAFFYVSADNDRTRLPVTVTP